MLDKEFTDDINDSFCAPEKKFNSDFSKKGQNSTYGCIKTEIIVICLLMENKTRLKLIIKISEKLDTIESKEKSCKEYIYEFSVDHGAFDKFDILNIDKCLMVKNNMKQYLDLLRKCLLGY